MAQPAKTPPSPRYRLAVASRVLAAALGGYTLTSLLVACVAKALQLPRVESMLSATLPAFLILTAAVLWVFAARSAWRAWLGLLGPCLVLATAYAWLCGTAR
ncbi:DUF3649 domain-containing protein [Pseudomonas sp. HR96]|uniref:DUF3649 domain-containing protein n=1 Tax=Pseudomonas sp. HR96 TaxID=1027966 RepID=UPI002A75C587|nr:DUF3649 domain-containing protein [Pseudomonas sp. HR96]WPO97934.1 DUF3649 domain-containing protein [Pseudomonas sp. HR96]